MRHLIIAAHPKPKSFNHAVAAAYMAALAARGHAVACRDLYALTFNPVLSARDLADRARGRASRDIRAEQVAIRRADALTLIAPLWWSGFPAMLKGYIDRVFAEDFLPALRRKKGAIVTTAAATEAELREAGTLRALRIVHEQGFMGFCGMELAGHLILDGITPAMGRAEAEQKLETVRRFVRRRF